MKRLKEFMAAAGLSVLLTTGSGAQAQDQDISLSDIEADSISITTTNGRLLFNKAATSAPSRGRNAQPQGRGRRGGDRASSRGYGQVETGQAGTSHRSTKYARSTGGRRSPQALGRQNTEIKSVEDCVEITGDFIKNPPASVTAAESGARATRGGARSTRRGSVQGHVPDFVATCFNNGKPVAKITFSSDKGGQTDVDLIAPTVDR